MGIEALKRGKRPPDDCSHGDDDGGSKKGSDRLYRRKARRFMGDFFMIFILSLICLAFLFLRSISSSSSSQNQQQQLVEKKKGIRWVDPRQVPPIDGKFTKADLIQLGLKRDKTLPASQYLRSYKKDKMTTWQQSFLLDYNYTTPTIRLDYTKHKYTYPTVALTPPPFEEYPPLDKLESIINHWPQDEYDSPPTPFIEKLQHFDFNNQEELQAAIQYRELELPFKVYNVPEVITAGGKWTLDYLSAQFDTSPSHQKQREQVHAAGYCEEVCQVQV